MGGLFSQSVTRIEINGYRKRENNFQIEWKNSWLGYDVFCTFLVFLILYQMVRYKAEEEVYKHVLGF